MFSILCKSKPGKHFSGKCTKLVTKRRSVCFIQEDLSFLRSAVTIYVNRGDSIEKDAEMEKILAFLEKLGIHDDDNAQLP